MHTIQESRDHVTASLLCDICRHNEICICVPESPRSAHDIRLKAETLRRTARGYGWTSFKADNRTQDACHTCSTPHVDRGLIRAA